MTAMTDDNRFTSSDPLGASTGWTNRQLDRIASAEVLLIATPRADGTFRRALPIWVVRHGDALYVRSYRGTDATWYRSATDHNRSRISAGGVEAEVAFTPVGDAGINGEIDAAYRDKYGRYGPRFVEPMVGRPSRDTTLKLVPRP